MVTLVNHLQRGYMYHRIPIPKMEEMSLCVHLDGDNRQLVILMEIPYVQGPQYNLGTCTDPIRRLQY